MSKISLGQLDLLALQQYLEIVVGFRKKDDKAIAFLYGYGMLRPDGKRMFYIHSVDVLPEYRKKGIASALTSRLAVETLARGKVPFYCCAWSNIKSARNAIKSGFRPAWVEMTVKPANEVDEMNRKN